MKQKILLSILTFLLTLLFLNNTNAAYNVVGPYSTLYECNSVREENSNNTNVEFSGWDRSQCYEYEGKYQYSVCKTGKGCLNYKGEKNTTTFNKTNINYLTTENLYKEKLFLYKGKEIKLSSFEKAIKKYILSKEGDNNSLKDKILNLEKLNDILKKVSENDKYKKNKYALNFIGYFEFELKKEIELLKSKDSESLINDLFNDLNGNSNIKCPLNYPNPISLCGKEGKIIVTERDNNGCAIKYGCENNIGKCIGEKPNGEGVFISQTTYPANFKHNKNWHYDKNTSSDWSCAWKCKDGYIKSGNSCKATGYIPTPTTDLTIFKDVKKGTILEAEDNYIIVKDVGDKTGIKKINIWTDVKEFNTGRGYLSLFDKGDSVKFKINALEDLNLYFRGRAGYSRYETTDINQKTSYKNAYIIKIDGKKVNYILDENTISDYSSKNMTYYGTFRVNTKLTKGNHVVEIASNQIWTMLDNLSFGDKFIEQDNTNNNNNNNDGTIIDDNPSNEGTIVDISKLKKVTKYPMVVTTDNTVVDGYLFDCKGGNHSGLEIKANNITVKNSLFKNCKVGIHVLGTKNKTIYNTTITGNRFEKMGTAIQAAITENTVVSYNEFVGIGVLSPKIPKRSRHELANPIQVAYSKGAKIIGNLVDNRGYKTHYIEDFINLYGDDNEGLTYNHLVENNILIGSNEKESGGGHGGGIVIDGKGSGHIVRNNKVYNTSDYGIANAGSDNVLIENNLVYMGKYHLLNSLNSKDYNSGSFGVSNSRYGGRGCGKNVRIKNNKIFSYAIHIDGSGILHDHNDISSEIWKGSKNNDWLPSDACTVLEGNNDANYGKDTVWPLPGNIFANLDKRYFSGKNTKSTGYIPTPNTSHNNVDPAGKCIGKKPTGEGIFTGPDTYPENFQYDKDWSYHKDTKSDRNCRWKCKDGYERNGNSCKKIITNNSSNNNPINEGTVVNINDLEVVNNLPLIITKNNTTIENKLIDCKKSDAYGIIVRAHNVTIKNSLFRNCRVGISVDFYQKDVNNVLITGNRFENMGTGIKQAHTVNSVVSYNEFVGIGVLSPKRNPTQSRQRMANAIQSSYSHNQKIIGNLVDNRGYKTHYIEDFINLFGKDPSSGERAGYSYDELVENNILIGSNEKESGGGHGGGIVIDGKGSRQTVRNNKVYNTSDYGIANAGSDDVLIENNLVYMGKKHLLNSLNSKDYNSGSFGVSNSRYGGRGCGKNVKIRNNKVFSYAVSITSSGELKDLNDRSNEIWKGSKTAVRVPSDACYVVDGRNDANYGKDTVWPLPGNIFANLDKRYFSGKNIKTTGYIPTPNTSHNNVDPAGKCIGKKPTGEGIFTGPDTYPENFQYDKDWSYHKDTKSDRNCRWKCKDGYERNGNSCKKIITNNNSSDCNYFTDKKGVVIIDHGWNDNYNEQKYIIQQGGYLDADVNLYNGVYYTSHDPITSSNNISKYTTLEQYLDTIKSLGGITSLDVKAGRIENFVDVLDIVKNKGMLEQIFVWVRSTSNAQEIHKRYPSVKIFYWNASADWFNLSYAKSYGIVGMGAQDGSMTNSNIEKIHNYGLKALAGTFGGEENYIKKNPHIDYITPSSGTINLLKYHKELFINGYNSSCK